MIKSLSQQSAYLNYRDLKGSQTLYIEDCNIEDLVKKYDSPLFIYSKQHIVDQYSVYQKGLSSRKNAIHYAVKANPNINILKLLHQLGSCFDVVSKGELQRVLHTGCPASKVVFSGVGKSENDLSFALESQIGCINIESSSELNKLNSMAKKSGYIAPISLRINPNIDAKTHPYISTGLKKNKFGIPISEAIELYRWASQQPHLQIKGVTCHIGSQLIDLNPLTNATHEIINLVQKLTQDGIEFEHVNLGGGIGISYSDDEIISEEQINHYFNTLIKHIPKQLEIHVEPGRFIVGNAGVLVTQVEYLKSQNNYHFAVVNAAMNDLIRPALYQSYHKIVEVKPNALSSSQQYYDVVGPICESADFLAKNCELTLAEGDLLAVLSTGAYCTSMGSNYNSRLKPAEVLVDCQKDHLIRKQDNFKQLIENELLN